MPKELPSNKPIIFLLAASIFGLLTVLALVAANPVVHDDYSWRKPVIGSLFSAICIAGATAAFRPNKCTERFEPEETRKTAIDDQTTDSQIEGHHPDCGCFSAHTIAFSKRVICAACSGLALGAFLAVLVTVVYVFAGSIPAGIGRLLLIVGGVCVLLGFAQLEFKGFLRLALNTVFVCGAYFVLIGADILAGNAVLDLYVIGLIGFWIWTRIALSDWDHRRICSSCSQDCGLKKL
jgi:hypothetical protein